MDDVTAHGHESIKKGSKSFALASRVLPPELRDDASMLYAWCRHADDLIDGQIMGHDQITDYRIGQGERLELLRLQTQNALDGKPTDDPVFSGLTRVVELHDIDHKYPHQLIKGFEMDVSERVYKTVDDILDYGYHVAGVVGVMMANIMGAREAHTLDRASDLGIAFQLTNIARDVVDDAMADRVFVPQDLLTKHGAPVSAQEIAKRENWPTVFKAANDMLDIADGYYTSSKVGIADLPFRCAWAISAALSVYQEIGETLRRQGPEAWEGRVHASTSRKLALAFGAVGPAMRRKSVTPVSREGFYTRP